MRAQDERRLFPVAEPAEHVAGRVAADRQARLLHPARDELARARERLGREAPREATRLLADGAERVGAGEDARRPCRPRRPTIGHGPAGAIAAKALRPLTCATKLYANGWVVTMDDAGTEHPNGWVLVDGAEIVAVGGGEEPGERLSGYHRIDCSAG